MKDSPLLRWLYLDSSSFRNKVKFFGEMPRHLISFMSKSVKPF